MKATPIDGRKMAIGIRKAVSDGLSRAGMEPSIATVLAGGDEAVRVYIDQKARACKEVGIRLRKIELAPDISTAGIVKAIGTLNGDRTVNGIIIEMPLPKGVDVDEVVSAVHPDKDIDGMTPLNMGLLAQGRPCLPPSTPAAVMHIIDAVGVELEGSNVTVVNHSRVIGRPLAQMLLARNATVRVAHVFTKDLATETRDADVLVVAAGVPKLITADMVKEGAVVIDCGMNRLADGSLTGDVDMADVGTKASKVTPVPGGVGPVTVAMLLINTMQALIQQGLMSATEAIRP